jgi:hypothetical protein
MWAMAGSEPERGIPIFAMMHKGIPKLHSVLEVIPARRQTSARDCHQGQEHCAKRPRELSVYREHKGVFQTPD